MKKILLLAIIITISYSQVGFNLTGGMTYSSTTKNAFDGNFCIPCHKLVHVSGIRFGIEKEFTFGIIGATYLQRGYNVVYTSQESNANSEDAKLLLNYVSGYIIKPFEIINKIDLLIGGEFSYLHKGKYYYEDCTLNDCESSTTDIEGKDFENMEIDRNDYGFLGGVQYNINSKLSLVGIYYIGLADYSEILNNKVRNRSFQIYASYGF